MNEEKRKIVKRFLVEIDNFMCDEHRHFWKLDRNSAVNFMDGKLRELIEEGLKELKYEE